MLLQHFTNYNGISSLFFFSCTAQGHNIVYKTQQSCENSQAEENLWLRPGFSLICSRILPNISPQLLPGYEGTENM